MEIRRSWWRVGLLLLLVTGAIYGQSQAPGTGNEPSAVLDAFKAVRNSWYSQLWGYASHTFGILAFIDVLVMGTMMVVEGNDLHSFSAKITRKMLVIGAFYALLVNGNTWIPWVIDSFSVMGQTVIGGPLSPSVIFTRGVDLSGQMEAAASKAGFLSTNVGTALSLELASIVSFLAFTCICIEFTVVTIESYLLVGAAAPIFLGFGGSRWTQPYVERLISLAVAIGVKLICVYLTVSLCMQISATWLAAAAAIDQAKDPAITGWEIAGSSLILLAISWRIPKFFAAVLGGTPQFSGGDLAGVPLGLVSTALGAAALVTGGAGALGAAAAGAGASGSGSASIAKAAQLPAAALPPVPSTSGATGPLGSGVSGTNTAAVGIAPQPAPPAPTSGPTRPSTVPPPRSIAASVASGFQRVSNLAASAARHFDQTSGPGSPGFGKGD